MRNWTNGIIDRAAIDVGRTRSRRLESRLGEDQTPGRRRRKAVRISRGARGRLRGRHRHAAERRGDGGGLPRAQRPVESEARRQARHRHEHGAPGDHDIGRYCGGAAGRGLRRMPRRRQQGSGEGRQAVRPCRGRERRCRPCHAAARAAMPPHRTCRAARRRRDHEACGESAAAGLLAGAWRGADDLQAAQSSARPADRYPFRHRRRACRHEGARRHHRKGFGRRAAGRDRVRHYGGEKGSGHGRSIRRFNPCRASGRGKRAGLF